MVRLMFTAWVRTGIGSLVGISDCSSGGVMAPGFVELLAMTGGRSDLWVV